MNREYLPATEAAQQELVLLHGWGSNREVWRPLLASLRPWSNITLLNLPGCAPGLVCADDFQLADLLAAVIAAAPPSAVYVGWSLGGQLALQLAAFEPQRVEAVVTLCSNPCFVANSEWPGMAAVAFADFCAGFEGDAGAALRRFGSLQVQGAQQPRSLLRQLQSQRPDAPGPELMPGLAWLAQLDQRALLKLLRQPQLHLLAEHDGLVPLELAPMLTDLLAAMPTAQVGVLAGASHAAPLDSAAELAAQAHHFLASAGLLRSGSSSQVGPDKKEVAQSFSRAAVTYDSVAKLQRDVGARLLTYLDRSRSVPSVVLDLGCGTGSFRSALRERYPCAEYVGLDLAQGMVEYARAGAADDSVWLVGDAESLPLAESSVDLIFSSLAIQWCPRPEQLFAEWARVLRPGGRCVFTTLGPDTLCELRQSWAAVDAHQHVNQFLPATDLLTAGQKTPGIELSLTTEHHCMQYQRVGELLAELKALGAHNMNRGRPAGLTSRKVLQGMLQAYERWRVAGMLPASYQVIFGEVQKK